MYITLPTDPGYIVGETHGLIAAASDQSDGIPWNDGGDTASADTIYAVGLALAYRGGDYTDWHLPDDNQLNKLYLNKTLIGGFSSNYYWGSQPHDGYDLCQSFLDGTVDTKRGTELLPCRAVRAF